MTPEKLFHELLGLGLNWEVIESRFDPASGTVFLEIRETAQLWESVRCPKDTGGGLLLRSHRGADLAASQRFSAPVRNHLPVAQRQMPAMRSCVPGASAVGGVEHALHQGV